MCRWVTPLRLGFFSIFLVENEKIQELNGFQKADFLYSKLKKKGSSNTAKWEPWSLSVDEHSCLL